MRNDGIFFLTSGAPQGGAALAPYKGFAGGVGAGLVPARRRAGVGIGPYGRSAGGHKGRPYKEDTMRYKTRSTPQRCAPGFCLIRFSTCGKDPVENLRRRLLGGLVLLLLGADDVQLVQLGLGDEGRGAAEACVPWSYGQ